MSGAGRWALAEVSVFCVLLVSTFGGALLEREREEEEEDVDGLEKDGLERIFMGSLGCGR
ncbi:hypothetical protein [Myxococcus xanthus]|uniref:hypothetical protein n=1 Tax=Myxococcus xanthus TaxID=34 RepID=UPI00112702F1|nr:hypothetical protein [Myxococcus xanthus]QDE80247.1 hypothetical protein BHS07_00960 [Myxococcus xanthus]